MRHEIKSLDNGYILRVFNGPMIYENVYVSLIELFAKVEEMEHETTNGAK